MSDLTDLSEFLLARIAEDEVLALTAQEMEVGNVPRSHPWAVFSPARVLAECEAKRRIVERYAVSGTDAYGYGFWFAATCLALVYSDHPDFRAEWRL